MNEVSERHNFRKRSQLPRETIDEFVVALKGLASTCNFVDFCGNSIRSQLIEGIRDHRIRVKLLQDHSKLENCIKTAKRIEEGIATAAML